MEKLRGKQHAESMIGTPNAEYVTTSGPERFWAEGPNILGGDPLPWCGPSPQRATPLPQEQTPRPLGKPFAPGATTSPLGQPLCPWGNPFAPKAIPGIPRTKNKNQDQGTRDKKPRDWDQGPMSCSQTLNWSENTSAHQRLGKRDQGRTKHKS